MTRKKPTSLLVFGILNLVFGGLRLLAFLCCGGFLVVGFIGLRMLYEQAPDPDKKQMDEFLATFSNNLPGFVPIVIASFISSLVLALLEVVSGIGLVRIRSWGQWLCAIWALLEIAFVIGSLTYQFVFLAPAVEKMVPDLERWMEKQDERQRQKGQIPAPRQKIGQGGTGNPYLDNASSIVINGFSLGYSAVAFIFMILPQTGRAIARYHGLLDNAPSDKQDDYFDDDYRRRRRDGESPPGTEPPPQPGGY